MSKPCQTFLNPAEPCLTLRSHTTKIPYNTVYYNRMTKPDNNQQVRSNNRYSRIRAIAPPRSNEYYNSLINANYNPELGSKEAHDARQEARLNVLHSENEDTAIRQEAARDLRLHGQSLTRRIVKTTMHCECLDNDLICLKDCK